MYQYRRMIAAVNLNENDAVLVHEAAAFAELAGTEKISYVHVLELQEIPAKIKKEYPQLVSPFREMAEEKIKKTVVEYSGRKSGFDCLIKEGRVIKVLLEEVKSQDADIVVIGRNYSNKRSHKKRAENIARKAPCSVYIVPAGSRKEKIKKILVASDGSNHAKLALEEALQLAKKLSLKEVHCVHVYHVPMGFHSTGKSYEEFADIMLNNAKADHAELLEGINSDGIKIIPDFQLNDSIESGILKAVEIGNADLLVVGARGRSTGASVLLGSVTEHLIGNVNIPLLAVKNKAAGVAFFDALLNVLMLNE